MQTNRHNPLKRSILEILKESKQPLKEYDLHTTLGGEAFSEFIKNCSLDLSLFRKHFLVMNALYELHHELLSEGLYLQISALEIQLIANNQPRKKNPVEFENSLSPDTGFQKLSQYYRNWDNFNKTNDNDVSNLLQQFWNKFLANEEKTQSLQCLELTPEAGWTEIQQKYKQLCQQHHPDKGGDGLYFIEIRQAYDNLKLIFNKT